MPRTRRKPKVRWITVKDVESGKRVRVPADSITGDGKQRWAQWLDAGMQLHFHWIRK